MDLQNIVEKLVDRLPNTVRLRAFGITKIPLLFLVSPKVRRLSAEGCEISVPLNYFTKNHLGSMYFGALTIGADTAVGLLALELIKKFPQYQLAPIFKDLQAQFLKRAETDVLFQCSAAQQIEAMITKSANSGERVTEPIRVRAVSANNPDEVFAEFSLGLSLKAQKRN